MSTASSSELERQLDERVDRIFRSLTTKYEPEVEIAPPPDKPGVWVAGKLITSANATKFIDTVQPEWSDIPVERLARRVIVWLRRNEEKPKDVFYATCHDLRVDEVKTATGTGVVLTYTSVSPRGRRVHVMAPQLQRRLEELIGIEKDPIQWYPSIMDIS
ncbi:hypothetical protein K438DRAFT_2017045 [Mycena galopus ATCC 62051]|nr:hypothetical protein K438DRAFT_2017045 [Mycena galopus ATCC 62051]